MYINNIMVVHECQRCNKNFDKKSTLVSHLRNKKKCEINSAITNENMKTKIELLFEEHQALLNNYNILNESHGELKIKCENLESKLQISSHKIYDEKNPSINNYTMNGNNTTMNNTIDNSIDNSTNIVVINFSDSYKHYNLKNKDLKYLFDYGLDSVLEFLKLTHFNKSNYQFHNVFLPSWTDRRFCKSFENNEWGKIRTNGIINKLSNTGIKFLMDSYNNNEECGRNKRKNKEMEKFIAYVNCPESFHPEYSLWRKNMEGDILIELDKANKFITPK